MALLPLAGCGSEDKEKQVTVADAKIIKALDLEKQDGEYQVGGDTACLVSRELLNTQAEVAKALKDKSKNGLVVPDRSNDYGVVGVPIFPPSCATKTLKDLADVKVPAPK
jgi:hypothetical protein